MIVRVWHGWAPAPDAHKYEEHFHGTVLKNLRQVEGFRAAQLWRQEDVEEVEFVAVTTWESIDAVRGFAGADYASAVVEPEARRVLTKYDERVMHYEVVASLEAKP